MSEPTKVVARLPPNEPLLTSQGLPAMSWLYFFQLLGRATDQVVAADLPTLVDQARQLLDEMALDLVPLQSHKSPVDVLPELQLPRGVAADVLPELSIPQTLVEVLPELARPVIAAIEPLDALSSPAALAALAQRLSDLELWSLS